MHFLQIFIAFQRFSEHFLRKVNLYYKSNLMNRNWAIGVKERLKTLKNFKNALKFEYNSNNCSAHFSVLLCKILRWNIWNFSAFQTISALFSALYSFPTWFQHIHRTSYKIFRWNGADISTRVRNSLHSLNN